MEIILFIHFNVSEYSMGNIGLLQQKGFLKFSV